MGNRVSIQACEFKDHLVGGTTHIHYGYRIYDDYGQEYNNCYDSMDEVMDLLKEETIMDFVLENHSDFYESIEFKGGLYLNGDWVDTEEITD